MAKYTISIKMVLYYCLSVQVSLTAILGEISPFFGKFHATFFFYSRISIHELFAISAILYSIFLEFWWTIDFNSSVEGGDLRCLHFDITIVFPVFEANVIFFDTTLCHLYLKLLCFIKNETLHIFSYYGKANTISVESSLWSILPFYIKLKVHKATTRRIRDTALTYREKLTQKSSPLYKKINSFIILLVFITVRLAQFNEYVNKSNLQTEDKFFFLLN
jgi:hypothetical protein